MPQRTCKPNSVRRRPGLAAPAPAEMTIPLGPPLLTGSSDLPGSVDRTGRPNGRSHAPPYLVLLRAGFCLPRLLPAARCALTAPFHPYPPAGPGTAARTWTWACPPLAEPTGGRYIFCATFRRVAPPGRYPAHCPVEFGLSSPERHSRASAVARHAAVIRFAAASIAYPSVSCEMLVLLELLVEVAARRVDHLGRLRDVPAVLAQLGHQVRPLRAGLELVQGRCGHPVIIRWQRRRSGQRGAGSCQLQIGRRR